MDMKERYRRRNYTSRRGGHKQRSGIPIRVLQKKRRDLVPKYAKWGDLSLVRGDGAGISYPQLDQIPRREAHQAEKDASTLQKNYRRTINTVRDRRKYWPRKSERDVKG